MAVYLVGAINIEDEAHYAAYVEAAGNSIAGHNIESLAVDDEPDLLEGDLPGRRIILMRFETREQLDAWYRSKAYQDAAKHRHAGSKTNFLLVAKGGWDPILAPDGTPG